MNNPSANIKGNAALGYCSEDDASCRELHKKNRNYHRSETETSHSEEKYKTKEHNETLRR